MATQVGGGYIRRAVLKMDFLELLKLELHFRSIHSAHCRLQWVKRVCTARTVGPLYCFTVGLQWALQRTVCPLHFELGKYYLVVKHLYKKEQDQIWESCCGLMYTQ